MVTGRSKWTKASKIFRGVQNDFLNTQFWSPSKDYFVMLRAILANEKLLNKTNIIYYIILLIYLSFIGKGALKMARTSRMARASKKFRGVQIGPSKDYSCLPNKRGAMAIYFEILFHATRSY